MDPVLGPAIVPVVVPAPVAAIAKMLGRCRGKGTGPLRGSPAGRTSAVAVRGGGGAGDASRAAPKSGGLVAFGLGQAIPRSEELRAVDKAALSFGACGSASAGLGSEAAAASPVAAVADEADTGEGACSGGAAADGLLVTPGAAELPAPCFISPAGLAVPPAEPASVRGAAG